MYRPLNIPLVKQALAQISDASSAMTSVLRNLADLATSIQMFRAIQTSEGPYSELRAQLSSIKAQSEESLAQVPAEVSTSSGRDDEDQCPNCRRWFGLDDLVTHVSECFNSNQPERANPHHVCHACGIQILTPKNSRTSHTLLGATSRHGSTSVKMSVKGHQHTANFGARRRWSATFRTEAIIPNICRAR